MNPTGDIYYASYGREKYRSVHPPSAPHEVVDFRSNGSEGRERPETGGDYYGQRKGMESQSSHNPQCSERRRSDEDDDALVANRNYFKMANIADCHDPNASWPHIDTQSMRNNKEHNQSTYFNLPLPDMPLFLQLTHFCVKGRTWMAIEEQINSVLSSRSSTDFAFEHRKPEFLWLCNFSSINHCSFQIRAYVDKSGENVVIEMQRLSGNALFFSDIYHTMRNEVLREVQLLGVGTSNDIQNDIRNNNAYNTVITMNSSNENGDSRIVEDDGENADEYTDVSEAMTVDNNVENNEEDSDVKFLLIPVLEMLRNEEYPDMQYEALKLICDLSGGDNGNNKSNNNNNNDGNDKSNYGNNSNNGSTNNLNASNSNGLHTRDSTRKQMREMGYVPILIDIVCKHFTVNDENNNNLIHINSPYTGLRAITAIVNISEKQNIPDLIAKSSKFHEFYHLISFISKNGLPNHNQSLLLQCLCKKILLMR